MPATTASNEANLLLAMQKIEFIQREVEENKREFEADLKRVKEDADAEIRRVREKADADDRVNKTAIAALVAERDKALRWGISTLGLAVAGMATWIFNLITGGHIK